MPIPYPPTRLRAHAPAARQPGIGLRPDAPMGGGGGVVGRPGCAPWSHDRSVRPCPYAPARVGGASGRRIRRGSHLGGTRDVRSCITIKQIKKIRTLRHYGTPTLCPGKNRGPKTLQHYISAGLRHEPLRPGGICNIVNPVLRCRSVRTHPQSQLRQDC